jgi:hypothetical protein
VAQVFSFVRQFANTSAARLTWSHTGTSRYRQNGSNYLSSNLGAILQLLRPSFDLLSLLENGHRENFRSVDLIDQQFEVAHLKKKLVHRFAEFLFLGGKVQRSVRTWMSQMGQTYLCQDS